MDRWDAIDRLLAAAILILYVLAGPKNGELAIGQPRAAPPAPGEAVWAQQAGCAAPDLREALRP